MLRIAAILFWAIGVAACGAADNLTTVANELEQATGIRPEVGFNTINGQVVKVTVFFPRVHDGKPLGEVAQAVRNAVTAQFNPAPADILLAFAVGKCVSPCNAAYTMPEVRSQTKALESELEQATGIRPQVEFNWVNGRLVQVTPTFPRLYDGKPLGQLADTVRNAVTAQFKREPENVALAFKVGK